MKNSKTEVKTALAGAFLTTVHGNFANSTTLETTEALSFSLSENISANRDLYHSSTQLDLRSFFNEIKVKLPIPKCTFRDFASHLRYARCSKYYSNQQSLYFKKTEMNSYCSARFPPEIFVEWDECSGEATIGFLFSDGFYTTTFKKGEDPESADLANEIKEWTKSALKLKMKNPVSMKNPVTMK
eukprot:GHVP01013732.1.p1 GENE.GHVP01013732.1~~GHVP01013732.1.p1  ORF type:complete len:185 (+),score=18.76 GHVP01013732.1:46-600(+)